MIIAINYSDENFRESQLFNTKTAYKKGKVNKVIEYSPKDIDSEFYNENKKILSEKRGGGYWLWKPYFILKTMDLASEGDYIFYCDSGAYYINKIEYLVNSLEASKQNIMLFDLPLIEEQWTQQNTFDIMECNNMKYKNSNQVLATYILVKVNDSSKKFIKEYLQYCCNEKCLIDNKEEEDKNRKLINHRHDQSILSLLAKKYNLISFRDPSQYGIRPWEYRANGRMYKQLTYKNSNYPQILVSHRKANINKFRAKEFIKRQLTKINLLNEKSFIKKNNINV